MKDQINTIRAALAFLDARFGWAPGEAPAIDALRAALTQIEAMAESVEPVAWMFNRVGSESNPFFMKAGQDADYLRVGRPPLLGPSSAHVNWTPLYAAPVAQQYEAGDIASASAQGFRDGVASVAQQPPKLEDIEQYRLQMAGISTAAMGYWKEGDSIHPDYDTPALRDVAKLYAQYDALYKAQQPQAKPFGYVSQHTNGLWEFSPTTAGVYPDTAKSITAVYAKQPQAEPDFTHSKTAPTEIWKNRLNSLAERLEMADGAVAFEREVVANLRERLKQPQAEAVPSDTERLDYLQKKGATVSIVLVGSTGGFAFQIGGIYLSTNENIRAAIDAAMAQGEKP